MPKTMAFHSKLRVHVQKLIYETEPFAYFLFLKVGHKLNQFPRAKKQKSQKNQAPIKLDKAKKKLKSTRTSIKGKKKLIQRCKPTKQPVVGNNNSQDGVQGDKIGIYPHLLVSIIQDSLHGSVPKEPSVDGPIVAALAILEENEIFEKKQNEGRQETPWGEIPRVSDSDPLNNRVGVSLREVDRKKCDGAAGNEFGQVDFLGLLMNKETSNVLGTKIIDLINNSSLETLSQ